MSGPIQTAASRPTVLHAPTRLTARHTLLQQQQLQHLIIRTSHRFAPSPTNSHLQTNINAFMHHAITQRYIPQITPAFVTITLLHHSPPAQTPAVLAGPLVDGCHVANTQRHLITSTQNAQVPFDTLTLHEIYIHI